MKTSLPLDKTVGPELEYLVTLPTLFHLFRPSGIQKSKVNVHDVPISKWPSQIPAFSSATESVQADKQLKMIDTTESTRKVSITVPNILQCPINKIPYYNLPRNSQNRRFYHRRNFTRLSTTPVHNPEPRSKPRSAFPALPQCDVPPNKTLAQRT